LNISRRDTDRFTNRGVRESKAVDKVIKKLFILRSEGGVKAVKGFRLRGVIA
jgi:hypothetical protein